MELKDFAKENDRIQKAVLWAKCGGRCYLGCSTPPCDVMHIFTRSIWNTRWDTHEGGNVVIGCRKCHSWQHNNGRQELLAVFVRLHGLDSLDILKARKQRDLPCSRKQWAEEENLRLRHEYKAAYGVPYGDNTND